MKFAGYWLAASPLALAGGLFSVPDNAPNGVYVHSIDSRGKPVHELVRAITEPLSLESITAKLAARQSRDSKFRDRSIDDRLDKTLTKRDGPSCYTIDHDLSSADIYQTIGNFDHYCDTAGNPYADSYGRSVSVKYNGVVAYMCNYYSAPQRCYGYEMNDQFSSVWRECVPGAASGNPPPRTNRVGWYTFSGGGPKNYGYTATNYGFC